MFDLTFTIDAQGTTTEIEVDGGVNGQSAPGLLSAGADVLVVGSALFPVSGDMETATRELVATIGTPPTVTTWA